MDSIFCIYKLWSYLPFNYYNSQVHNHFSLSTNTIISKDTVYLTLFIVSKLLNIYQKVVMD
jgi:hypothetical protein